ncbi:MAG: CopG family transcriptional regulator [Betaproteobacteria bacterium]|nr:CopG family transcriptional regulator [Betaproteobacteria bacterium]
MRTTLTLDKDVSAALERLRKARHASLKQIVNDALRQGLGQLSSPPSPPRRSFHTKAVSLGRCLVGNVDNVAEVLAIAEGETFQ